MRSTLTAWCCGNVKDLEADHRRREPRRTGPMVHAETRSSQTQESPTPTCRSRASSLLPRMQHTHRPFVLSLELTPGFVSWTYDLPADSSTSSTSSTSSSRTRSSRSSARTTTSASSIIGASTRAPTGIATAGRTRSGRALLGRDATRADAAGFYRYHLPAKFGGKDGTNLGMAIIREHLAAKGLGLHNDLQNESIDRRQPRRRC